MVAEIIVDYRAKQVDKPFDYLIPEEFEDRVKIGSRVLVPFMRQNREIEGFCVGLKPVSKAKKLKSIIRPADDTEAFDEKMLEVIKYMHERYLASYQDIIRAVVPAGTSLKSTEWIVLCEPAEQRSQKRQRIVELLLEAGGEMEAAVLGSMFENDARTQISDMISKGELRREYRQSREIKDKTVKAVRLAVKADEARREARRLEKKAPVQARMLDIISAAEEMTVSELAAEAEGSANAITALYQKGLIGLFDMRIARDEFLNKDIQKSSPLTPTDEQQRAIERINEAVCKGSYVPYLLHGVTGSGKTEVFMQAIANAAERGKSALVLVPEISLTPQMVSRFLARFGRRVAVLHSGLSMGERYDQWKRIKNKEADIVIGARSAVFAPLDNIGIIIVDEEHSDTYKSEMTPRYHAVEIAKFRARQYKAALVLASATPSIEDFYKSECGEYNLIKMTKRPNSAPMPDISIVDMRSELARGNRSMFSSALRKEIQKNIDNGEQTILLLNRRGFSTFVSCRSCGYAAECPNCNISLTYHKYENNLQCHYCGYTIPNYTVCPVCGSKYIRYFGGGTQRVEEELERLFPLATIIRMDIDTTGKKQGHEKILERFANERIDILVGTQMVSKGLDFENVTLVGVITADTMLHINDFRSAERTFDMLEQVCGRAGRGKKTGRALIQTYNPDNTAITLASAHDYEGFYKYEINERKRMWYPPFSKIIGIMFQGASDTLVSGAARFFVRAMKDFNGEKVQLLGPIPAALSKIKNKYRWQVLIKCNDDDKLNGCLRNAEEMCRSHDLYKSVSVIIDKNPNSVY
ncbi:MAG: primosomal protein N' [Clostridiales bacterium]|nr:primosomal protein N' [Clostridiales bacterium]